MDIKTLWKEHKVWFFLLLPLIILIFFKDLIMEYLIGSARKKVRETEKKDKKLKKKADEANKKADDLKEDADKLGKQAEDVKGDPDWHKKR